MGEESLREKAHGAFVQQESGTTDGAACLSAIATYYGEKVGLSEVRAQADANGQGTTLLDLYKAAEEMGLDAGAFEADLESLEAHGAPCILHVGTEGRQRFIVCYGYEAGRFVLGDPAAAAVSTCSAAELAELWASRALLTLEPAEDFAQRIAAWREEASDENDADPKGEEYRCLGVTATPLGSDYAALRSRRTDGAKIVPAPLAQLLLSLERFDTLDGHAAACLKHIRQRPNENGKDALSDASGDGAALSVASVRRQLNTLAREGLLVSQGAVRTELLSLCQDPEAKPETHPITTVGLPTKDRPDSLERALESYLTNTQRYGRSPTFVIADDSEDPKTQQQNRQTLRRLKERYSAELFYAGKAQKRAYAEALAQRADVQPEITHFALLGEEHPDVANYGASRNALLLGATGEVCMQVDDDTVCEVAAAPGRKSELLLTSKPDTYDLWFFDSHDEALEAVTLAEKDFLGVHEQLLGKRLRHCLKAEAPLRIGDVDEDFLDGASSLDARIAVSFAGAVGDSGMRNNQHRIFLEGNSYERLAAQAYRSHLNTRQILRVPLQPAVSNGFGCMTMNVGLDARELLSPFMPAGRNEDGIFGGTLKTCFSNAYRSFLPYAIRHVPPAHRAGTTEAVRFVAYNANDIVLKLIFSFSAWPHGDGCSALRGLGRYLQDLGALSLPAFTDYVDEILGRETGQQVLYAQQLLARKQDAPAPWKEDVERYIRSAREAVAESRLSIPSDLPGTDVEKRTHLQERVRRYGELLTCWPALVEAASDLQEKGHFADKI